MSQSLQLLNSEILATVSTIAGISRTPSEWSDADKSDMRQCIRRGLRKFYQPQLLPDSTIHQWRFLERKFYNVNDPSVSDGAIRIEDGVATIFGGTYPDWITDAIMVIDGKLYFVTYQGADPATVELNGTNGSTVYDNDSLAFNGTSTKLTSTGAGNTVTVVGHTVSDDNVGRLMAITAGTNFNVGEYTVASVDTAANTWVLSNDDQDAASGVGAGGAGLLGDAFTAYRYRYPLPPDFAEFIGAVTYTNGSINRLLKNTDDKEIRLRYSANSFNMGGPVAMYSIQHGKSSEADVAAATVGADTARWFISYWPAFESGSCVTSIYRASPLDNLDATDITDVTPDYVQVDPVHAETLMAAILSSVDEIYNDRMDGIYHTLYLTRLQASIAHDRHSQGNQDFGSGKVFPYYNMRALTLLNHVPTYDVVS